jgi:hypothetical protein
MKINYSYDFRIDFYLCQGQPTLMLVPLTQKINKRTMARTIPGETRKGRPKKGQKTHSPKGPKRGRELVSLRVGSYLTHNTSNVTNMQIVKFNSSGRSKTSVIC